MSEYFFGSGIQGCGLALAEVDFPRYQSRSRCLRRRLLLDAESALGVGWLLVGVVTAELTVIMPDSGWLFSELSMSLSKSGA